VKKFKIFTLLFLFLLIISAVLALPATAKPIRSLVHEFIFPATSSFSSYHNPQSQYVQPPVSDIYPPPVDTKPPSGFQDSPTHTRIATLTPSPISTITPSITRAARTATSTLAVQSATPAATAKLTVIITAIPTIPTLFMGGREGSLIKSDRYDNNKVPSFYFLTGIAVLLIGAAIFLLRKPR
jgi:hypothetical protein